MNNFVFCVILTRKLKKHLPLRERFASTIHFDLNIDQCSTHRCPIQFVVFAKAKIIASTSELPR